MQVQRVGLRGDLLSIMHDKTTQHHTFNTTDQATDVMRCNSYVCMLDDTDTHLAKNNMLAI